MAVIEIPPLKEVMSVPLGSMSTDMLIKIHVFYKEFPFLNKCDIPLERLGRDPRVEMVDLNFLDKQSSWKRVEKRYFNTLRFILIDNEGEIVARVGWPMPPIEFDIWKPSTWFSPKPAIGRAKQAKDGQLLTGGTIMNALDKLENPDRVAFIVEIEDSYESVGYDSDPRTGLELCVHRFPAKKRLSTLLVEAQEEARKRITKDNV